MVEINITKTCSAEKAEKIAAALRGKTYMNLYVNVCPFQGEMHVNVGTLRARTSKAALTEMVLDVMASAMAA